MMIEIEYNPEKSGIASVAYDGHCDPEATEADIVRKLGEGSWGYSYKRTSPWTFEYKKWTD